MQDNIVVHNIRLNLTHEEDYAIHKALMNYNQDIYKSKNYYMKSLLRFAIYGERDYEADSTGVVRQKTLVSAQELKEILSEFKVQIMKEISEMVISIIMGKIFAQLPVGMVATNPVKSGEEVDDELATTACKYFDGI